MIDWDKQQERVEELAGGNRAQDGDIINLEQIKDIKEIEDTFALEDGKEITVHRFVYVMSDDAETVVPDSLHAKISKLKKEYGTRLVQVKVEVKGQKLKTRYDALPVL
jgi:tRNA 2-selenouridine synthase SelU